MDVTLDELKKRLGEEGLAVVDVRSKLEYDGVAQAACDPRHGHIQGARNIPLETLLEWAERLAGLGVPGEHRLALMVESTGHYLLGRAGQQLGDGLDHDGQHLLAVLPHPARLGMAIDLVAAGLGHGTQLLVEQRRLDSGGPLVDAEQQHPRFLPHPSLSTAARCG